MAQESQTAERETADVEHQIKETTSHPAKQVEVLQDYVGDMVQDATAAGSATIKSIRETVVEVQETVKGTVTSVKHALHLGGHVRRHPWLMLAGAVALGYVSGSFLLCRR